MEDLICQNCSSPLPAGAVACSRCGAPVPTAPSERAAPAPPDAAEAPTATGEAAFTPGQVINRRYRIVSLVGRGGMGEVYRADDLTLGQPVALKFLPAALARDPGRLARFRDEVRLARKVSHPHVCRVYDIGEAGGRPFLSMEFIDGENLDSLLRRIGPLPPDKGVELARQVCAGLAAAHEQGVLHRDLKPANVMIDGLGQARITDFGLAAPAGGVRGDDVRSGTPAYMAPEQRAGREVTVRSDLYALGMVLYKLFTGRRPGQAMPAGPRPAPPSQLAPGLDPRLDRLLLACLEEDPADRPPSASAVSSGLPGGGDLVAAAVAAGQTPAPELVRAADRGRGGLHPAAACAVLLAAVLGGLAYLLALEPLKMHRLIPLDEGPPDVMTRRARQVADRLGYPGPPADSSYKYFADTAYLKYLRDHGTPAALREALPSGRPPVVYFWYAEARGPLVALDQGLVSPYDPAPVTPGMVHVSLDLKGRLIDFLAVPDREVPAGAAPEPDWQRLFDEAELGPRASFAEVPPRWTPPVYADRARAWDGACPGLPDVPVHVEAATYRGRPVSFQISYPAWGKGPLAGKTLDDPPNPTPSSASMNGLSLAVVGALFVVLIGSALLLARRNLRLGRADWRGVFTLGVVYFLLGAYNWIAVTHHAPTPHEAWLLVRGVGIVLVQVALLATVYLAAEPYVRRRWPEWLVSWGRLLAGAWRDARVGRDVLVGCAAALVVVPLAEGAEYLVRGPAWLPDTLSHLFAFHTLNAPLAFALMTALAGGLGLVLVLLLLALVCRKTWLAMLAVLALILALDLVRVGEGNGPGVFAVAASMLLTAVTLGILWRFGALALVVFLYVRSLFDYFLFTTDVSSWYGRGSLVAAVVIVGLLAYGFVISLGGRPLLRPDFFGDPELSAAGRR